MRLKKESGITLIALIIIILLLLVITSVIVAVVVKNNSNNENGGQLNSIVENTTTNNEQNNQSTEYYSILDHLPEFSETQKDPSTILWESGVPLNANPLTYQNGSLFMYVVVRSDSSGTRRTAHAEPILRTQNGLVITPTNATNHTREQFASLLNPLTSLDEVLYRLSLEGTRQIYSLGIYQITGIYENPLNLMITQSNCSGDGEHRRGSGTTLIEANVNNRIGIGLEIDKTYCDLAKNRLARDISLCL